jgi:glycine hydroxymethyltransferase
MNAVGAIAVTLEKAKSAEFKAYAQGVLDNAQILAARLMSQGGQLVTGGTSNHMIVMDTMASFGLDGRVAEETLDKADITTNKQIIPDDPNPPLRPSGIRLGTPAATARGMGESEMNQLADWMVRALSAPDDESLLESIRSEVHALCQQFPVPGI